MVLASVSPRDLVKALVYIIFPNFGVWERKVYINAALSGIDGMRNTGTGSVRRRPGDNFGHRRAGGSLRRTVGGFVLGVAQYKAKVRAYYFEIMLSNHSCPLCGEKLRMMEQGKACCRRGHHSDPTTTFQKSRCCGAKLVRCSLHYACACCGKTLPSRFLFDERIFDRAYFRQRMAESRAKTRQRREMMRLARIQERSRSLTLTEEPRVDLLPVFRKRSPASSGLGPAPGMRVSASMRRSVRGFMSIVSIFWIWWQDTARSCFPESIL